MDHKTFELLTLSFPLKKLRFNLSSTILKTDRWVIPKINNLRAFSLLISLSFLPSITFASATLKENDVPPPSITTPSSARPIQQISSIGSSTAGALVEGVVGSSQRKSPYRYYTQSPGPTSGFLGPQDEIKPTCFRDQPGVSPAPLVGEASITFQFHCTEPGSCVIPAVVRPDGTIYQGLSMTPKTSPQTVVISAPAQTGIYTLFVIADEKTVPNSHATVQTSISTDPKNRTTLNLQTFDTSADLPQELTSAEFVYAP